MNNQFSTSPTALCFACLSSERQLNHIEDKETKQIFSNLLHSFENSTYTILLCYECLGRLKSVLRFRRQVQEATLFLSECAKYNNQPTSLSRLEITKTKTYEWEPDPELSKAIYNKETIRKHDSTFIESDNELSDNFDSDNLTSDNPTSDFGRSNIYKPLKPTNLDFGIIASRPRDTCEIKTENVIHETENIVNIKEEPLETGFKRLGENVIKTVTNYEFSDSDDEPLKAKKAKKKQVKKEVKELNRERPAGVVSGVWVQKKLQQLNVPAGQLEMVVLSWEEVESERQKSLGNATYTRHEFRCPSCVVGFNHRFKLDSHLKKHLPEAGDLECGICKTRFKTQSALLCHRRRHRSRWRCRTCSSLFSRAAVAADHVARAHGAPTPTHACHVCGDKATSLGKLRVHLKSHAERQHCEQCGKTFRDKSSLRTHLYIHTNQMDFSCEVCDKKFRFKKALEIHSITHQASELLYCADCDMNFKNRLSFYQHINYSMKHIHPDKIKAECGLALATERKRYIRGLTGSYEDCAYAGPNKFCFRKASASRPALRTHTRMVHRNKRLERNHVCHTCGKAYTTKKILEGHIRSHTGERPFVCTRCPATFSHDAALYNHNKLVHKTPFVRRRKTNAPTPEEPINWTIGVVDTEKVPRDTVTSDP